MEIKVREGLYEYETMDERIRPFVKMFLCDIVGVVVRRRESGDDHIVFEIISEDDGRWFPYSGQGASSAWLENYLAVLNIVMGWLFFCAMPDLYELEEFLFEQHGWKFKPGAVEFPWQEHPRIE